MQQALHIWIWGISWPYLKIVSQSGWMWPVGGRFQASAETIVRVKVKVVPEVCVMLEGEARPDVWCPERLGTGFVSLYFAETSCERARVCSEERLSFHLFPIKIGLVVLLELSQSDHQVLGHLLPPLLSFSRQAALGRVPVVPKFFHSRIMEATLFVAFPRWLSCNKPISELCRQFLWPHSLVLAPICTVSCAAFHREEDVFPQHVQSVNLPPVDSNQETSQHQSGGTGGSWDKGLNTFYF